MDFEAHARACLSRLRRTDERGAFHVGAADAPAVLVTWDSAHAALALAVLDPAAALAELRGVYARAQRADGEVAALDLAHTSDERAVLIAPPVAAFVAAQLAAGAPDLLECATRELDAIWEKRLPPDTPLPVVLHPLETGASFSPLFESIVEPAETEDAEEESAALLRSATAVQLDPERALRAGHPFVVEDPVFCGWFLLALEETARAWDAAGDTTLCRKLRVRGEMIAEGIASRLFWEEQELYVAWNRQRQAPMRVVTAGGLLPAAARGLREEGSAKRVLERHLRPAAAPLWNARGIAWANGDEGEGSLWPRAGESSALAHFVAQLVLCAADRSTDARIARTQIEALAQERGFAAFYVRGEDGPPGRTALPESLWPALALGLHTGD